MKLYLIKTIYLFGLIDILFDATLILRHLTISTLGGACKARDALQRPAAEVLGGPLIHAAGGKEINLASRRGKITIVEFWTFACGNCLANLPAYANWQKRFADKDVVVI